jgi:hypothetical protein
MQRPPGFRAPGSHVGYPHGKDKKKERALRTKARLDEKGARENAKAGE